MAESKEAPALMTGKGKDAKMHLDRLATIVEMMEKTYRAALSKSKDAITSPELQERGMMLSDMRKIINCFIDIFNENHAMFFLLDDIRGTMNKYVLNEDGSLPKELFNEQIQEFGKLWAKVLEKHSEVGEKYFDIKPESK